MENTLQIEPKKYIRRKAVYFSGDKYGYLTLTGKCYIRNGFRYTEAICECGKIWFALFRDVLSGRTKSCGCKRVQLIMKSVLTHGLCSNGGGHHPIYKAWGNMKSRCNGSTEENIINYTNRGIIVCEEWANNFISFYNWAITNGWKRGLTLDRIENDGIYEPGNCRWATDAIQTRNTRQNFNISAFGETKCLEDWINDERCSVKRNTIKHRIKVLKWDNETAITKKAGGERGKYKNRNTL